MEILGSRNLTVKTSSSKDVDKILFISEGSIPTIRWNMKEVDGQEG
jgi:hypothetical protein